MPRTCVLGLGNLLWADEGFGVRVAERLYPLYDGLDDVSVIDGGTQGLALLPWLQQVDQLLIIDAIDFAMPPGTLAVFRDQQVPAYLTAKKLSLHQTSFAEVLGIMQLMGDAPAQIVLVGVQPACLEDYGGSLSGVVKGQLDAATGQAISVLAEWGIAPRAAASGACPALNHHSLAMSRYEAERPDSDSACRVGDERVLARRRC